MKRPAVTTSTATTIRSAGTDVRSNYFAAWLERTLSEQGISGSDVARAVGVSDGVVSRWKSGKGRISLDNARKLAAFLGVDPLRLLVTAGLMSAEEVSADPLPIPENTKTRELVLEQIDKIKYLTDEDKQALIGAYDQRNESRNR